MTEEALSIIAHPLTTTTTTTMLTPESLTAYNDNALNSVHHLEQVQALLTALDLLSQLSSMDSTLYQSTLVGNQVSSGKTADDAQVEVDDEKTSSASCSCSCSSSQLQQAIDALQKKWKLEDTPVPMLAHSIHSLHSHITVQQSVIDQQAVEMEELRSEIQDLNAQKRQLVKFTKSLQCQNEELTSTIQKLKRHKKTLIKAVKTQVQHAKEQEQEHQELLELNRFFRMQAHEQTLSMNPTGSPFSKGKSYRRVGNCHTTTVSSIMRHRTCSHDTADTMDVSECTSATAFLLTDDSQSSSSMDYCCDGSTGHTMSDSSFSSLVTDEGIATVKFLPLTTTTTTTTTPETTTATTATTPQRQQQHDRAVTLTFPCGTKMGVRVRPVELEATASPSSSPPSPPISTNKKSKTSSCSHSQEGQRSRSNSPNPCKGRITKSMLNGDDDGDGLQSPSTATKATSSTTKQEQPQQPIFSINNLSAFLGGGNKTNSGSTHPPTPPGTPPPRPFADEQEKRSGSTTTTTTTTSKTTTTGSSSNSSGRKNGKRTGFLVYGYTDKCEIDVNQRPPIGARIVAINGKPVSEQWTMTQLLAHMKAAEYPPIVDAPSSSTNSKKEETSSTQDDCDGDEETTKAYESKTYSVTFRNDPLNKKQKEILALSPMEFQALTGGSKASKNKGSSNSTATNSNANKSDARSGGSSGGFFTPPTSPSPSFHNNNNNKGAASALSSPSSTSSSIATTTTTTPPLTPTPTPTTFDVAGFQLPRFFG